MRTLLLLAATSCLLAGCKADLVEVRVNSSDLKAAIEGGSASAKFIASFSSFGDLDAEQRQQIDAMEEIIEANITVDDFQITTEASKTNITVEGELPIIFGAPGSSSEAFAIYVSEVQDPLLGSFAHVVQLTTGKAFGRMESEMQGVSYMLAVDAIQPVQYRLRSDSGEPVQLLAGGVQIDGENYPIYTGTLADGDRISLTFAGGPYDGVSGAFLIGE